MKITRKRIALGSLAAVSIIALPVATVVSCGKKDHKPQPTKGALQVNASTYKKIVQEFENKPGTFTTSDKVLKAHLDKKQDFKIEFYELPFTSSENLTLLLEIDHKKFSILKDFSHADRKAIEERSKKESKAYFDMEDKFNHLHLMSKETQTYYAYKILYMYTSKLWNVDKSGGHAGHHHH